MSSRLLLATAKEEAAHTEEQFTLQLNEKAVLVTQLRDRMESCR